MKHLRFILFTFLIILQLNCAIKESAQTQNAQTPETPKIIADSFAYPVGKMPIITQAKDKKDNWYNAQDFGENNHLGEDWNINSGGNTDCGEPVYAAAGGTITYAEDFGGGWGNVVIIEHTLPGGKKVQTLYGHLEKILRTSGEVKKREQIGTVGNAKGVYLCHLHFEIREETCPMWNQTGKGYDSENKGWLDPSDFIDSRK